jgi:hypothetical protein
MIISKTVALATLGILVGAFAGCQSEPEGGEQASDLAGEPEPIDTVGEAVSGTTTPGELEVLTCVDSKLKGFCDLTGVGFHAGSAGVGNDTLSSFRNGLHARVTYCEDANFGGVCATYGDNVEVDFLSSSTAPRDNKVSSMRVVDARVVPECRFGAVPPSGWVFLYRDANFLGDCVSLQRGNYTGAFEFGLANDSISSLKIGASLNRVILCKDGINNPGCTSHPTGGFTTNIPTLGENDTTSSLVID